MPFALKLTYRGVCRKLVFTDVAQLTWDSMEHNVRTLFHLTTPFSLQYEDDEGEVITCNSTFELREVIPLLDAQGRRAFGLNVVPLDVRSQATYHRIHHYLNEVSDGPLSQDSLASMDSGVELQVPQRLEGRRAMQRSLEKTPRTAGGGAAVLGTSPSDPVRWPAAGARVVPSGVERKPRHKPPKASVSVPTLPTHWNLPPSVYSSLFESSLYPVKRQAAQPRNESRVSTGLKSVASGHPSQAPPPDMSRTRSHSHLQVPGSVHDLPAAELNLLPDELTDIPPAKIPTAHSHSHSHSQALPNRSAEAIPQAATTTHHSSINPRAKSPGLQDLQFNLNPHVSQTNEPSAALKGSAMSLHPSLPQPAANRSQPSRQSVSHTDQPNSVTKSTALSKATSPRTSAHGSRASLAPPSPRPAASRSQASPVASPRPLPHARSHHSSHHASVAADPSPQDKASPPPLPPVPAHLSSQLSQRSIHTSSRASAKPTTSASHANSHVGGGESLARSQAQVVDSPETKSPVVEPVPQPTIPTTSANFTGSVAHHAVTGASMASALHPTADALQASMPKFSHQSATPSVHAAKSPATKPSTPLPGVTNSGLSRKSTHQALAASHSVAHAPSARKSASLAKSRSASHRSTPKGGPLAEPEYDTTELIPPRLQGSISHLALDPPVVTVPVAEPPQSPGELSKTSSTDTPSPRLTASLLNISEKSEDAAKSPLHLSARRSRQPSIVSAHSTRGASAAASFVAAAKSLHRLSPQRSTVAHNASAQSQSQHPSMVAHPQLVSLTPQKSHVAEDIPNSPTAARQSSQSNVSNAQLPKGSIAASHRSSASKHASMSSPSVQPLVAGESRPKSPLPPGSPVAATTTPLRSGSHMASRQPSQVVLPDCQAPAGSVVKSQATSPGLPAHTSLHQTSPSSMVAKEASAHCPSLQPSMAALSQRELPLSQASPVVSATATKPNSPAGSRLSSQIVPPDASHASGSAAVSQAPMSPLAGPCQSGPEMQTFAHHQSLHTYAAPGTQQPEALTNVPSTANAAVTQPTSAVMSRQPSLVALSNGQLPPAGSEEALHAPPSPGPVPASAQTSVHTPSVATAPLPTSPTPGGSPVPCHTPAKAPGTPELPRQPSQAPLETTQLAVESVAASPAPASPVAGPKSSVHSASQHSLAAKDTSAVGASWHPSVAASPSHVSPSPRASPAVTKPASPVTPRQPSPVHPSAAPSPAFSVAVSRASPQPSPTPKSLHSASVLSPETEARSSSRESSIESVVLATAPTLPLTEKQSHASATSHPGAASRASLQPSIVISPPTPDLPAEGSIGTRSAPRTGPQSAKQSAAASPRSSAHPSPRSSSPPVSQAEPSPEAPPQLSQATSSGAADQQLKQSLQASRASPSLPPVTSHQPSVTEAANPTPSPGLSGQRSRVSVAQSPTSLRAMSRQPSVASVTGTIAPKDTTLPPSDDAPKPMSPVPRSPNAASPSLAGAKSLEQLADQATAQQPSGARSPSALKPVTSSEAPQSKDASGVQPATPPTGQTSHVGTSPPLPATPPQASVAAAIEETSQVPSATNLATPGVQSPKNSTAPISRASPYASQLAAARSRASLNRSQASPKDTRPASQHPSIAAASNSVAGSPPRSALSLPKSEHASPALSPTRVPSSVEPVAALVEGKSHDAEPNSNVARSVHGGHPLSQRGSQASVVKDEAPALPAVASLPLHVSMVKSRSQLSEPAAPSAHASRLQVEAEVEPVVVVEQLASPGQAPTSPAGPATSTPHSPQASMAKSHAPSPQRSSLHDSQLLSTAAAKDGTKAVSEVHEVAQPAGSAATSPRCSQLPTNVTRSPTATAHEPSVHTTASTPGQGPVNAKGVSNASGDPAARPTSPRISAAPSPPSRQSAMSAVVADGIKSPVPAPGPSGQASLGSPVAAGSETPNTIENRSMIGPTEPAVLSTTALAAEASSHQLPVETGAQAISNQELSIPRAEPEPELAPASTSPALPPSQLPPPTMLSKSIEAIRAIGSTSQHALSQSTSKATQTLATATSPPEPLVASRAHTGSQPPSVHDGPTPQPKPEDTSVADNSRMTRTSTAERIQQIRRPSISQLLERQASGNVSSQRSRASRTASQIEPSPAQPSQTGALESRSPEKVVTPSPPPESPRMIESPIWEPENNEKKITPKAAPSASNASHPLLAEASATSMSASQLEDQEQKLQELRSVLVTLSKSLAHLHSEAPSHPALAQLGSTAAIAEIDKQLEAVHQEQKQQSEAPPQASQLTHRSGSHLAPEAAATAQDQPASYHSTNAPSDSVDVLSEDASVHTMTPISSPKGWVGSGSAARLASSAVLDSQPSPKQGGEPTAVPLPKAAQLSQPSLLSVSQADHEVAELARVLSDPHSAAVPPAAALTDSHYSPVVISNRSSPHTVTPIRNGSRHSSPPAVTRVPTRSGSPLPAAIGGEGTSPIRQSSPDPQGRGANDSFFTGSLGSSLLHSPLDASPHPSGKASPQHSNSVVLDPQAVDAALASSIESSPGVDMAEEQRRLDALTEAVHTSAAALATVEAVTSAVKAGSLSVATYQDPPQLPPSPNVSHVARIPLPLSRSASAIHTSSIQVAGPEAVVDATPAPALRTSAEVSSAAPAPVADSHGASHGNFHPSKVVSTVQSRVASFEAQSQAPAAIAPSAVPSRKSSRSSSGQSTFDQAINFPLPASVATFVGQATSAGLGTSQRSSPRSPQARPVQASGNSHLPTAVKASLLAPAGTSRAPSAIASAIQEPERQADAVHVPQIVDEMVDQLHDVTGVLNSLMDGHPDFMEPITDVIRLVQSTVLNSIDHVARSLVSQRSTHPLATTEAAIVPSAPEIDVVAGYTSVQPAAQDKPVSASINGTPHRSENHASRVPSPAPMLSPKPSPTPARASQTPEVAKKTAEPSNAKCALQPSRPPSPRPMTAPPMANGAAMNTSATCSSLSSAQRSPMVSTAAALSQLLITKEKTLSPRQSVHGLPNASMVAPGSAAVAQPLPDPAPLPIHATTSPQKSPSTSVVSSKEKSATTEPSAASPPEANADAVTQPVNAAGSHSPTIPPTKISSVSETYTPAVVTGPVEILPTPSGPTSRGESTGKSATKASAPQSPPADPVQAPTVSSTRLTPPGRRTPQPYQQPGASMQSRHDSRASGAPPPPPPPPESHGAQPLNASISSVRSADHGSLPSLQSDSSSIASYDPQVEPSTPSPLLAERRPTGECSDHPSIAVSISGDPSCAEGIPVGFTPGDGGPPHDGGHHSFYHHRSGSGLWQDSVHGSYHYYRTFSERYPGYQQQYSYSQHQHAHHRTAGAPPYGQGGGKSPPTSAPTADPGFPTMANRGGQFPTGFACCPLGQPHSTEYQADKNHDTSNTRFTADTTNDTTGFRFSTGRGGRWEHAPVTSTLPSRKPKRSSRPPKSASASDIIDIPVVHYSANSPQDFRVDEAVADELHRGTQKIVDLGFRDYRTVHRVLKQSGGDVEVAIKRLEFMQAHPV